MRHYALRDSRNPSRPAPLFEIDVDFRDVRSEIHVTDHAFYRGPWMEGPAEPGWTADLMRRLEIAELIPVEPPWEPQWPDPGDRWFLDCLLNDYRVDIRRNSVLGIFSQTSETLGEFEERCRETLQEERFQELRPLREVFLHRIMELEKRARRQLEEEEWNGNLEGRTSDQIASTFSRVREDLGRWFGGDRLPLIQAEHVSWTLPTLPDVHDRLQEMKHDLISAYNRVAARCEADAKAIEPYSVSLTLSAVRIVSRNILWE